MTYPTQTATATRGTIPCRLRSHAPSDSARAGLDGVSSANPVTMVKTARWMPRASTTSEDPTKTVVFSVFSEGWCHFCLILDATHTRRNYGRHDGENIMSEWTGLC